MSLWTTPQNLKRAQRLFRSGIIFDIKPGVKVAREFADIGFEEFCVLPGQKIVSLFTGAKSELPPDYQEHFFVVPSVQDLFEKCRVLEKELPVDFSEPFEDHLYILLEENCKPEETKKPTLKVVRV